MKTSNKNKLTAVFSGIIIVVGCNSVKNEWQKARETCRYFNMISTSLMDYHTDNGSLPVQEGPYTEASELYKALVPKYLRDLPVKDTWGNNIEIYCGSVCEDRYGIKYVSEDDFLIVSKGRDGLEDFWMYDEQDEEGGFVTIYKIDDFSSDIVMLSGSFIKVPMYDGTKIAKATKGFIKIY